jgi:lipooligosaccharide transport system ATP-binding protein
VSRAPSAATRSNARSSSRSSATGATSAWTSSPAGCAGDCSSPTVGLDPQVRQELWALIDALRSEGTTLLMSTHYIEEAERLADTVLIMSHGTAVAAGPPADLVLEHAGREALEVYGAPARLAEVEAEAGAHGLRTRRTGTSVSVLGIDGRNGFRLEGERRPANLEDVFVLLTGEEIG